MTHKRHWYVFQYWMQSCITTQHQWYIKTVRIQTHPTSRDMKIVEKYWMKNCIKIRYVVPKEADNGRDPVDGFVLQDSSSSQT